VRPSTRDAQSPRTATLAALREPRNGAARRAKRRSARFVLRSFARACQGLGHVFMNLSGKEPTMRLFTVLPHVNVSARPIAQLAALAFMLSGCSVLDGMSAPSSYGPSSSGGMSFGSSNRNPYTYYLTNGVPQAVQKEYVDRYACASGTALACNCASRLAEQCECRC
jgi:hypothetical protein